MAEAEPLKLARCKVCGTRWLLWPDLIPGGGWNLLDQYQRPGACCDNAPMGDQIEHLRDLPLTAAPASPSAPSAGSRADDGRGLAVDMIDVDRLREVSAHLAPHRRTWLRELADRLATQITETLSLRADDKAHRKEIRLLKAEHDYERDAANDLREIVEELRQERDALRAALETINLMVVRNEESTKGGQHVGPPMHMLPPSTRKELRRILDAALAEARR